MRSERRNPNGGRRMVGTVRKIAKAQGWLCPLCGKRLRNGQPFNIDHIRPKARGGSNSRKNKQVAHVECNTRKDALWDGQSGHVTNKYRDAHA